MVNKSSNQSSRQSSKVHQDARLVPKSITTNKGKGKANASAPAQLVSNRPRGSRSTSSSGSEDNASSDGQEDEGEDIQKQAMLAMLEAQSRAMLGLDVAPQAESSAQARKRLSSSIIDGEGDEDEMEGEGEDSDDDEEFDDGWGGAEDGFVSDSEDEFAQPQAQRKPQSKSMKTPGSIISSSSTSRVPEVVFAPSTSSRSDSAMSKAERKAFMNGNSAKMMGIKNEPDYVPERQRKRARADSEDPEEQSNLKLDKTLHDMLLTNLLPSAAADSASRPVDKRNAMSGRLMELASYHLPGEGSKNIASAKHSSHSAHIRTGIIHAQAKREKKAQEEAKAAGNYIKGIGGLGDGGKFGMTKGKLERRAQIGTDVGKKKGMDGRNKGESGRDRGLSMGIGKFAGGTLRLSEREVARGNESASGGRAGGRGGRGGSRGKRGGKRR
ncbi:hypothetical protein IAT40_000102 [Kwoniella sp. CBS 6097]